MQIKNQYWNKCLNKLMNLRYILNNNKLLLKIQRNKKFNFLKNKKIMRMKKKMKSLFHK